MKIVVTGSLGRIGKPLITELVQKEHSVVVISSSAEREKDINTMGAKAAIGSLEDVDFLTKTFTDADAVYCMVPPTYYQDHTIEPLTYYRTIGNNYAQAIQQSGIKKIVQLSSFGAHLDSGTGFILGSHYVEKILEKLPSDVSVTTIRPTSFYYNLYGYINMIKNVGFMAANFGGEDVGVWVSPLDIATAVAEEITDTGKGRKLRYVASDELTCNEIAGILGAAIGKPDLKWIIISDEQMQKGLEATGMPTRLAKGLVELYASFHSGALAEDYFQNKPTLGKVKMVDFAKEFAAVYHNKNTN